MVHVYDLGQKRRIRYTNSVFRMLGTGAFHAGVEVYGTSEGGNRKVVRSEAAYLLSLQSVQSTANRRREVKVGLTKCRK